MAITDYVRGPYGTRDIIAKLDELESVATGSYTPIATAQTLTAPGRYFITASVAVTLPDPATLDDGTAFGFSWAIGAEPTLLTVTDGFLTADGATDEIILDVRAGIELVVLNGVYQL